MYDGNNAVQKHIHTVEVECKQKSWGEGRHKCFWGVWGPKCFSGCMEALMLEYVWWQQCSSKIYTVFQKYIFPKCIFPKCVGPNFFIQSVPDLRAFFRSAAGLFKIFLSILILIFSKSVNTSIIDMVYWYSEHPKHPLKMVLNHLKKILCWCLQVASLLLTSWVPREVGTLASTGWSRSASAGAKPFFFFSSQSV